VSGGHGTQHGVYEKMKKLKVVGLIAILVSCSTTREDVVFEAFTEPFLDWYSLKLYSNGEFDLHIPSIDYSGMYKLSGDTVFLESIETEHRTMTTENKTEEVIKEQRWTFLIDPNRKKIRTIENASLQTISIDIVDNKLLRDD
jgi:hypothetical protein